MKHQACFIAGLSALAVFFTSGCAVTTTRYQREPHQQPRFSSKAAAATFYEAVLDERFPDAARDSVSFAIKIPKPFARHRFPTRSSILADAARRANSNRDGLITGTEASNFARQTAKNCAER